MPDKPEKTEGATDETKTVSAEDAAAAPETISEEDLRKSLEALETPKEEGKEEPKDPNVETATVKTAADVVKEEGSEELKKALEISDVLTEFAGLIGAHVDQSIEVLQKSVHEAALRDLSVVKVLESLRKSLDENTEAIKAYGEQPGKPATTTKPSTGETEVLQKGAEDGDKQIDPEKLKQQVTIGLEHLVKSAKEAPERQAFTNAAIAFESTGQINDAVLQKAIGAYRSLSQPSANGVTGQL